MGGRGAGGPLRRLPRLARRCRRCPGVAPHCGGGASGYRRGDGAGVPGRRERHRHRGAATGAVRRARRPGPDPGGTDLRHARPARGRGRFADRVRARAVRRRGQERGRRTRKRRAGARPGGATGAGGDPPAEGQRPGGGGSGPGPGRGRHGAPGAAARDAARPARGSGHAHERRVGRHGGPEPATGRGRGPGGAGHRVQRVARGSRADPCRRGGDADRRGCGRRRGAGAGRSDGGGSRRRYRVPRGAGARPGGAGRAPPSDRRVGVRQDRARGHVPRRHRAGRRAGPDRRRRELSGLRRGFRADRPCPARHSRWPERDRGRDHVRAPRRRGRGDEWRVRRDRRRQDSASGPGTPGTLLEALSGPRRCVYLLVALLSTAGVWAASILPSAIYPELTFARVTIVATGTSLGARQQLFSVSRPIEEAVSIVPGVTRVRSRSIRGGTEINVEFSPTTEMVNALQEVRARVDQIVPDLPAGVTIQVERMTPSLFPILSYNVRGGDPATLYDIARYQIKPLLSRVPGVGRVDVLGSDVREIEVVADPVRLAQQRMTFDELAAAIHDATSVAAVGRVPDSYKQYLVVTATEAHAADDIARIVVGHGLRVRDLATVTPGTEDRVSIISGDGEPVAEINITRQVGGNSLAIADSVAGVVRGLALPPGVRLKPVYDQASLVRDAVKAVRDAMLIGAGLAVIVLLLFLRHGRITAVSASSIPLTLVITIFVMSLLGQTFNLMTLGAMAIAIGLVIDDAVVITENIVRHLDLKADRTAAIRDAVQELLWPVTTSTLTTVVVFLPLGLLQGVVGQFFHALSITLTIAVLVWLGLACSVIPLLSQRYLGPRDAEHAPPPPGTARSALERLGHAIDALAGAYERTLGAVLHHPRRVAVAAVVLIAAGYVAYRATETGFLPEMDEGAFVLDYWAPGGTALTETDRQLHVIDGILARIPEVAGTSRRTGAELGLFATLQNRRDYAVRLKPQSQRD